MNTQKIKIGDTEYLAYLAITDEEKEIGLQEVEELEVEDGLQEGMLFIYDEPQHLDFWMKDTEIPLQIREQQQKPELLDIVVEEFSTLIVQRPGAQAVK